MNILELRDVSYRYDDTKEVLRDISFSVREGEHIALVGPNGSGKSTLFNLIARYLKPGAGAVLLSGKDVHAYKAREYARFVSFVPQGRPALFPFTVFEMVLMGLNPHKDLFESIGKEDMERAEALMRETGVWAYASKPVTEISGGELQRAMLTRALLQNTKLLLLDEALSELDISARIFMMKLLSRYVESTNITVIGIHHDLHIANDFASRLIALSAGRIVQDGSPAEVFTAEFFREVFKVRAELIPGKGFLFHDCC